jgi:outer membrane immunogenic protein
MARILFRSFALVVLLGGVANAADLPIGVPVSPPAILMPTTWDGPYVGLNLGGHWLIDQVSTINLPTGASSSGTLNAPGVVGGLQAGYNWQFANVVAGIEADANVLGGPVANRNDAAVALTNAIHPPGFLLTVRPRLGWAFYHRTLVYATAGYAFETVQVVDTINVNFGGTVPIPTSNVTGRQSGWTAGAGFEYAFSRGVSAKIEYLYLGLGTINSTLLPLAAVNANVTHKLSDNIVRAGVNFHLGY